MPPAGVSCVARLDFVLFARRIVCSSGSILSKFLVFRNILYASLQNKFEKMGGGGQGKKIMKSDETNLRKSMKTEWSCLGLVTELQNKALNFSRRRLF